MSQLPPEMTQALKEFGFSEGIIRNVHMETTLIADLRISGDCFDDLYRHLSKAYESNNRIPAEYVPSELSCGSFFLTLGRVLPWLDRFVKAPPLTLGMLDGFMRQRGTR